MNIGQLSILARELAQFLASAAHLSTVLHAEKRDATPAEVAPLGQHLSRVYIAHGGVDPSNVDAAISSAEPATEPKP